jgi:hypothetical protein
MLYPKICGGDNLRFNLGREIPRLRRSVFTLRKNRFITQFSRSTVLYNMLPKKDEFRDILPCDSHTFLRGWRGRAVNNFLPLLIIQVCILLELLGDGIVKVVTFRNCYKC